MESKNIIQVKGEDVERLCESESNKNRHTIIFDEKCPAWDPNNMDCNLWYVRVLYNYVNTVLRHRGEVHLWEIYQMLGVPHPVWTEDYGWIKKIDNFIDFNINIINNGSDSSIVLDFSVDGIIPEEKETL